jgi:hypothetical protein
LILLYYSWVYNWSSCFSLPSSWDLNAHHQTQKYLNQTNIAGPVSEWGNGILKNQKTCLNFTLKQNHIDKAVGKKQLSARCQWLTPTRWRSGGPCFEARERKLFTKAHLQNNQSKMDWSCGSSKRVLAEFKSQCHWKRKELALLSYLTMSLWVHESRCLK